MVPLEGLVASLHVLVLKEEAVLLRQTVWLLTCVSVAQGISPRLCFLFCPASCMSLPIVSLYNPGGQVQEIVSQAAHPPVMAYLGVAAFPTLPHVWDLIFANASLHCLEKATSAVQGVHLTVGVLLVGAATVEGSAWDSINAVARADTRGMPHTPVLGASHHASRFKVEHVILWQYVSHLICVYAKLGLLEMVRLGDLGVCLSAQMDCAILKPLAWVPTSASADLAGKETVCGMEQAVCNCHQRVPESLVAPATMMLIVLARTCANARRGTVAMLL